MLVSAHAIFDHAGRGVQEVCRLLRVCRNSFITLEFHHFINMTGTLYRVVLQLVLKEKFTKMIKGHILSLTANSMQP